ncbi:MAG: hypothetical protein KDB10_15830 [Acidimicrobiales bacterium]|nr:hypothetical protein [Acidimicrobiales bacterium]MCB9373602.1 hypothetical protein [Microthrixaceae bacterium]
MSWEVRALAAVAVRPRLWRTALVQVARLARPGWWRRWPLLPLPDRDYLRFRLVTAYGDPDRAPETDDLVTYLHWCRAWPRVAGG